jgi:enamine deaminase RidA (YjgF/YER057c/UK114 family)
MPKVLCPKILDNDRMQTRVRPVASLLVAAGLLCACEKPPEPPPPQVRQVFNLNAYEREFGYSQAVLVDKTLYISGSVPADKDGLLVAPGDMGGQMRAVYVNIQHTLEAAGLNFDHVVKETIYTTDMDALLKVADLRFEFYSKDRLPATAWMQVQRLIDPGFLVEIDVIAVLP